MLSVSFGLCWGKNDVFFGEVYGNVVFLNRHISF